ncbi:MAG: pyridoxal phosphate-dependent aminotransferase [Gemmatimonadetes bacterium]|nr:pyridoxal phosphate-dependent aminotransferase [Gemmatimonadota bacterium]
MAVRRQPRAAEALRLSSRSAGLKPTAVNSILAEVRALQAQGASPGTSIVSLMRGEPDFRTPAHICDAAVRALANGRTSYPDNRGEPVLREAVAQKLARDNQLSYDPGSEILVTTGATLGVYAALTTLLSDGDEVLLPDPIYDAYQSAIVLAGGRSVPVRSSIENGRFVVTKEALEAAATTSSRVLLLNSPWNPTGTVFLESELHEIADFVIRRNLILISDEIYEAIVYDGHRHVSLATLSDEMRKRTVLVNSLSKTYAMTGWRVGYCAGPAPLIQAMFLVLQQSSRGPATFIQDAAACALTESQECVREMRRGYADRRTTVMAALSNVPRARVLLPEGGFFAMVDVRETGRTSDEVRLRLLHEHGVVVMHGAAYGQGGEGTIRVSFASGGQNLQNGLERLREGLARL